MLEMPVSLNLSFSLADGHTLRSNSRHRLLRNGLLMNQLTINHRLYENVEVAGVLLQYYLAATIHHYLPRRICPTRVAFPSVRLHADRRHVRRVRGDPDDQHAQGRWGLRESSRHRLRLAGFLAVNRHVLRLGTASVIVSVRSCPSFEHQRSYSFHSGRSSVGVYLKHGNKYQLWVGCLAVSLRAAADVRWFPSLSSSPLFPLTSLEKPNVGRL